MESEELKNLYEQRFPAEELASKNRIWELMCKHFFSKHIPPESSILDIGAGYCEFLNNITAKRKVAVDLNPETKSFANTDIEVLNADCKKISVIGDNSIDIVFSSNFLEHLSDKEEVFATLKEAHRILKQGGKLILMGPNIKYLAKDYWDFFDHKVPLSHQSLLEVLNVIGFSPIKIYNKFMPYSTKSNFPQFSIFIKIYLSIPLFYKILGKQFLIIMQK